MSLLELISGKTRGFYLRFTKNIESIIVKYGVWYSLLLNAIGNNKFIKMCTHPWFSIELIFDFIMFSTSNCTISFSEYLYVHFWISARKFPIGILYCYDLPYCICHMWSTFYTDIRYFISIGCSHELYIHIHNFPYHRFHPMADKICKIREGTSIFPKA